MKRAATALVLSLLLASCATETAGPPPTPAVASLPSAPVVPPVPSYDEEELRCLALTIYWEGRSESHAGQVAIAHVVLNRMRAPQFPRTICGVVHDGGTHPLHKCQFQWWCDGKSDSPTNAAQWSEAQRIARTETASGARDPTGGALYFHNGAVQPVWTRTRTRTASIGQHIFYR